MYYTKACDYPHEASGGELRKEKAKRLSLSKFEVQLEIDLSEVELLGSVATFFASYSLG